MQRFRLVVTGQVQGVGFRPFVYRLAHGRCSGFVLNTPEGVVIEVQGSDADRFADDLKAQLPPLARIVSLKATEIPRLQGETEFEIHKSEAGEGHTVLISPDTATCPDCLADMADPDNRRHAYPFTNCTNCGPRYTITRSIPYDRPSTSMACFPLCPACQAEYGDPLNRRFHAQPNACPVCGPRLWRMGPDGARLDDGDPIQATAKDLAQGLVAAIKGLGGFHLACDAASSKAVNLLRQRKNRPDKPLAVMVPDLETARRLADLTTEDEQWLTGTVRPIVLARKSVECNHSSLLAPEIAPDTNFIGLMLPYAPLHHVLLGHLSRMRADGQLSGALPALVMTSGNMSSEPISLGNREALSRLGAIADVFLLHDRDILIRCDDSVLRTDPEADSPILMRRARGFTPSPVFLNGAGPSVLGLGPELKCTLCVTKEDQAFVSQHIGNMENLETLAFHGEILEHLTDILQTRPTLAVRDLHPGYMTTALASDPDGYVVRNSLPVHALQHHFAHAHAVLAENRHDGPALVLTLDGTGYGEDGTVWGGELLFVNTRPLEHKRLARFSTMLLPGGEAAVREPWRIAQALLLKIGANMPDIPASASKHAATETLNDRSPDNHSGAPLHAQAEARAWPWLKDWSQAARFLPQIIAKGVNCPATSSCGRLFDAMSAMLGLCQAITYEGQAAIMLERAQDLNEIRRGYPCPVRTQGPGESVEAELDTLQLFASAHADVLAGVPVPVIARRFHLGLIQGLAELAALFAKRTGVTAVGLSGGVMQNLTLAVELPAALKNKGLTPLVHSQLPPNDGCISLGQAAWGRIISS